MDTSRGHRSLYKATTPPWKETYRKRCVDRLRNSRSLLLSRYRAGGVDPRRSSVVQEVMEEEWSVLQSEVEGRSSPWGSEVTEAQVSVMEADASSVLEEIQQELMSQELSLIAEYEKSVCVEQQYVSSVVEHMDDIICPLCHLRNLSVNTSSLSCVCGLYINTTGDGITADVLRRLLESRVNEHMDQCVYDPVFTLTPDTHTHTSLLISCTACDFLSVVL